MDPLKSTPLPATNISETAQQNAVSVDLLSGATSTDDCAQELFALFANDESVTQEYDLSSMSVEESAIKEQKSTIIEEKSTIIEEKGTDIQQKGTEEEALQVQLQATAETVAAELDEHLKQGIDAIQVFDFVDAENNVHTTSKDALSSVDLEEARDQHKLMVPVGNMLFVSPLLGLADGAKIKFEGRELIVRHMNSTESKLLFSVVATHIQTMSLSEGERTEKNQAKDSVKHETTFKPHPELNPGALRRAKKLDVDTRGADLAQDKVGASKRADASKAELMKDEIAHDQRHNALRTEQAKTKQFKIITAESIKFNISNSNHRSDNLSVEHHFEHVPRSQLSIKHER